ncbi:MAG: kelch repeat-containing protein [Candidatus Sericytochromatia bacterium]|nr:kelch repeat-containing protein [Candidatus Sericytochromatia bacterium]
MRRTQLREQLLLLGLLLPACQPGDHPTALPPVPTFVVGGTSAAGDSGRTTIEATASTPPSLAPLNPQSPAPTMSPPTAELSLGGAAAPKGIWQDQPPLKSPRAFHAMFRYQGTVMAFGGDNRNLLDLLDEQSHQWRARAFPDPGHGWDTPPYFPAQMHPLGPATLLGPWVMLLGRPLEVGGLTVDFSPILFNPVSGLMGPGPSATQTFLAHRTAAGVVSDPTATRVVVAGGETTRESLAPPGPDGVRPHERITYTIVERIDFPSLQWQALASLPSPLSDPAIAWVEGGVIVAGGLRWMPADGTAPESREGQDVVDADTARPVPQRGCWRFDSRRNTWTVLPDLPAARHGARALVVDDKFWVIGGRGENGQPTRRCDILDLISGKWTQGPSLRQARSHAAVLADGGGGIWVTGGLDSKMLPTDSVEFLERAGQP